MVKSSKTQVRVSAALAATQRMEQAGSCSKADLRAAQPTVQNRAPKRTFLGHHGPPVDALGCYKPSWPMGPVAQKQGNEPSRPYLGPFMRPQQGHELPRSLQKEPEKYRYLTMCNPEKTNYLPACNVTSSNQCFISCGNLLWLLLSAALGQ